MVSFEEITKGEGTTIHRPILCSQHAEDQLMKYFCSNCQMMVCNECMFIEHKGHDIEACNIIQQREVTKISFVDGNMLPTSL